MLTSLAAWLGVGTGIATGALGGFLSIFWWEAMLKPRRERQALARTLAGEVALHVYVLRFLVRGREQTRELTLSAYNVGTPVFDAVASRLGELPWDLVMPLLAHHHALRGLRERVSERDSLIGGGTAGGVPPLSRTLHRVSAEIVATAEQSLGPAETLYTQLQRRAYSRWRPRRFRPPPSVPHAGDDALAEQVLDFRLRVERGMLEREARAPEGKR